MNLKVKTLHELFTMSLWLSNMLDDGRPGIHPKHIAGLRQLFWDTNAEITLRLFGTEDPIKPKQDDNITA